MTARLGETVSRNLNWLRLMDNNFVFMDDEKPMALIKQVFISAEPQLVYEVRKCKLRGLMEALYLAAPTKSDGKFLRPAYVPLDAQEMSFQLAFKPLAPGEPTDQLEGFLKRSGRGEQQSDV